MTPASMGPVIFDLDGVLVDSKPHWQYAYAEVVNKIQRCPWLGRSESHCHVTARA